ncbi:TetR/AcrR family transcriptional regulator [Kiloniella laminariae]|uniref:TetR/AcrR family transcriptional regulator n=1 Tax=Kiloniella laminariae TaxID=454162 RepID=A0ABT4LPH3_9PROT|nr:TetR/AcrR family transcriptional regulator [Kiloniella laminariae]MCZ4283029.1 TetR/AcrR family transcriptional regulator [Kiloniella laminariae]
MTPSLPTASSLSWLATALALLAQEGPWSLTIARLCKEMNLTKGSFYHHFKDLEAFKLALLAFWEKDYTKDLFEAVKDVEDPEAQYEMLFTLAFEKDFAADIAMRTWAQSDAAVRSSVEKIDNIRLDLLSGMYERASSLTPEAARNYAVIDYAGYIGFYSLFPKANDSWARDLASIQTRALLADSKNTRGIL